MLRKAPTSIQCCVATVSKFLLVFSLNFYFESGSDGTVKCAQCDVLGALVFTHSVCGAHGH